MTKPRHAALWRGDFTTATHWLPGQRGVPSINPRAGEEMKVRFHSPDPLVVSCLAYPRELRQIAHLLNGQAAELSEVLELVQAAAPEVVVCAYDGFIGIRMTEKDVPRTLIRFESAEPRAAAVQLGELDLIA